MNHPIVCCAFAVPVLVRQANANDDTGDMRAAETTTTVSELADYWRTTEGPRYVPKGFVNRDYYVRLFVRDMGHLLAETVTVSTVLQWFASKPSERLAGAAKRHRTWGKGTSKSIARTIIHLFHLGERHGLIERHRLKALVEHFEDGGRRRPVTEAEYQAMRKWASDDLFRNFIEFLLESGCRPGEARAMLWSQIDWDGGFVLQVEHKTARKTGKPRIIPLSNRAVELLCEIEATAPDPAGHVFLNEFDRPWSSQALTKRMETLRKRAKLSPEVQLHGLRHTALTRWAAKGMPIKLASQIAGHSSTAITESCYVDLSHYVAELRRAMEEYRT